MSRPAATFAAITRPRDGARVKVISAVRWVHSPVIDRMPSTGSSTLDGNTPKRTKLLKVWSSARPKTSWITLVATAPSAITINNHRPARVSALSLIHI